MIFWVFPLIILVIKVVIIPLIEVGYLVLLSTPVCWGLCLPASGGIIRCWVFLLTLVGPCSLTRWSLNPRFPLCYHFNPLQITCCRGLGCLTNYLILLSIPLCLDLYPPTFIWNSHPWVFIEVLRGPYFLTQLDQSHPP